MRLIAILIISLVGLGLTHAHARMVCSGTSFPVIEEETAASTGLDGVYVAYSTDGLRLTCTDEEAAGAVWSRYSSLGGGYAEQIATGATLDAPEGDMGYIVECGGRRYAFWLVDYSRHMFSIESVAETQEQECGRVALDCRGTGDEIIYYSINGRRITLSRDIELTYRTLEYDADREEYVETRATEQLEYLRPVVSAPAPLCPTEYTVSGDKFLSAWGMGETYTSQGYQPRSVECRTRAEQQARDASNEVNNQGGSLGGSAPCVVDFHAAVTDAAIFNEWQFSRTADFEDVSLRVSDLDFTHTFDENGVTYVRFYCANADASCDAYGETYEISIGESFLKCPNAFSPFNADGVNDEWKVSYSSIVEFECTIFNRGGHKIVSFNDPSAGWDGKYGGKYVPAGVYYYVIKARGADGRDYNLSGDINIVDYK